MTRVFLKPAIDKSAALVKDQPPARLQVRKPTGQRLSPEGEFVTLDSYWQRRLNDKDVEVVEGVVEQLDPAPAASGADSAPAVDSKTTSKSTK